MGEKIPKNLYEEHSFVNVLTFPSDLKTNNTRQIMSGSSWGFDIAWLSISPTHGAQSKRQELMIQEIS